MKTELTYLEARITALAAYVQELKKDHAALQLALVENTGTRDTVQKEYDALQSANEGLLTENAELKVENKRLQTLISESIQEIKVITELLPDVPKKEENALEGALL